MTNGSLVCSESAVGINFELREEGVVVLVVPLIADEDARDTRPAVKQHCCLWLCTWHPILHC